MENRVVVILGTTASGKNRLAIKVAEKIGAEIISMDSMKVFRGMDIGTAKPSRDDQSRVRHHLIDVVDPWEYFSVKRFVDLADQAVTDIHQRGKLAIVVGGTMLYFKAFYEGLFEGPSADPEIRTKIRARAESEGTAALFAELRQIDPVTADRIHENDLRRIERALEVYYQSGQTISALQEQWGQQIRRPDWHWLLVGVRRENENNSRRINMRVKEMVEAGLVEEAKAIFEHPNGMGEQASQAVGYQELFEHFRGDCPLDYAIEQVKIHSRRLAKHQRTWMRRLANVNWIEVSKTHKGGVVMYEVIEMIEGMEVQE